jgi:hypothetical protein
LFVSWLHDQGQRHLIAARLLAGQLVGRRDRLPAGVLMPEDVLTIDELEPGLAQAGLTVTEEPVGDPRAVVRSAG